MKTVIVCMFAILATVSARPEDFYTARYDSIDVGAILDNHRLLNPYISCVLGEGKCTAEGKELKSHIQEAMQTDCAKCTPTQKQAAERVISHLLKNEQDAWNKLQAKYDPTGKYSKEHESRLRSLSA